MDPQAPATATTARGATEPSQSQPPKPSPPLPPPSTSSITPVSAPPHTSPNPNPNPNPNPTPSPSSGPVQAPNSNPKPPTPTPPHPRPPQSFNRAMPPSQPQFPHFSSAPPPSSAPGASAAPRGGMAIGVPAHHQSPSPPFSSSFGQHFGGLGRTGVNVPESASNSSTSQVRAPVQGMGMLGSQMRPSGIAAHQQRPMQSSLRPPSSAPNNQPASSQSFQGHGLMRPASVGSAATPSPSASQSVQSLNQPWLSSGPQGKPPLPSTAYRQQLNPQSMQQRSHVPPQQQSTPTSSQQQHQQLQPLLSNQSQEHFGPQVPPSRAPLHAPHQQQVTRLPGPGNQKPSSLVAAQSSSAQPGTQSRLTNADTDESSNSILSKRSIHELVSQVDPLEKLDPEVADILVDVAENFLESITRSGCSLAKHRKSTTLEAKDILLHLEKNWNMTLPGFGGDEIKSYRRQITSDIHKERLAAIKKSMAATEAAHAKGSAGQASGSAKGSQAKTPLNIIGSPNLKSS
ncbi:hypothetical protein VNO78_21037 [Psophocarpus tetragonolobus]|uniref:Transcription initiation factor TFIID subunit 12 domain-containing protein n=1 Tax=Psophocarpus tetragonolobus TaxID=3891 RepID=A0AAN9SC11_PSOTE